MTQDASSAKPATEHSMSAGLMAHLAKHNLSIAFTSYQSGILYMLGRTAQGGAHLHQSAVPKPMGLCLRDGVLALTSAAQVMLYQDVLAPEEYINNTFDACYMPRRVHITGTLDAHDVGLTKDDAPVFVNTRFNALATVDPRHSFRTLWTPPFIDRIVDEDRCHLNGLAMDDDGPAYVTAVSKSNTIDGWRDRRADGGVVIDVRTNEIVCEGLSMPHSPRLHKGELWLLNSGTGELGVVANLGKKNAQFKSRVFCPGFLRGLRFHGNFAVVGLSKPRHKRFEGLALDEKLSASDSEPWCGIQIIDLSKGSCTDWFRIDGAVTELYDIEVLPNVVCPMAVSPGSPDMNALITYQERSAVAAPHEPQDDAATQVHAPSAAP